MQVIILPACNKCSVSVRVSSSFQTSLSRNLPVKIKFNSVKTCLGSSVILLETSVGSRIIYYPV